MPNEVHWKLEVAEFAFDFDTNFAEIDSLPDQDLCWSAPVTSCEDCEFVKVVAKIKAGTSPDGAVRFYVGRNGATDRVGTDDINTSDHGTEGTTADIDRVLGALDLVGSIGGMDSTDKIHTVEFKIWYPGASFNLYVFNDTGATLNGTSSPHDIHGYGYLPEIQ